MSSRFKPSFASVDASPLKMLGSCGLVLRRRRTFCSLESMEGLMFDSEGGDDGGDGVRCGTSSENMTDRLVGGLEDGGGKAWK
jgi:hypothetical protein